MDEIDKLTCLLYRGCFLWACIGEMSVIPSSVVKTPHYHINHEPPKPMSQSPSAKWRPCAKATNQRFCWASPKSFPLNSASRWCSTDGKETWTSWQSQRRRLRPGSSGFGSWFTRLKPWMRRRGWISILWIGNACSLAFLVILEDFKKSWGSFFFFFFSYWLLPLASSQVGLGLVSESGQKQRRQDDF